MPATLPREEVDLEERAWPLLAPRRGPSGGGGHSSGGGDSGGGGGESSGGSSSGSSGSSSKGTGGDDGDGSGSSSSSGSTSKGTTPDEAPPPYDPPPAYRSSASTFHSSTGDEVAAFGGGSTTIKSIPAGVPFSGREYDGGIRPQVYGSRTLGSGYPYGGGGFWLVGRPFPFGFWPIYYHPFYYGDDEYGPENNSSRPGGPESITLIQSNNTAEPANNTYHILGDSDSVRAVLDALVFNCSAVNSTISPYSANATGAPQPQQAIQYYRASSFVLFLDSYNNTAALPANAPPSNTTASNVTADTPLPSGLDMTFLNCINETIGNAVPMTNDQSSGAIAGVIGAGVGTPVWSVISLFWLVWVMCRHV
ncbi:hypothetical protein CALVIDRAFT_405001 [Calocera viscosa TUFC12733]|uniref:Uncharacterized protein n=1 Tax=Calocera viscosa (strain TUFC12733) TaxID=1330018 RepID=A0A167PWU2_CALVF|nr:hypothetical protein CALVIDRAFT_405001 [Calocera viscosa TUFC12733]